MTTTPPDEREADPTVRQVERADLLDVYRIEQSVFPQPWPFEAFERFCDEPGFLVAELRTADGPTIAGYVVADLTPNFGRDIGHVKDLAVREECRGRGLGRLLLRHALASLEARGATVTRLEVRASNDGAIALYRDHGFQHRRTVPRYYADGENALVMVRERG
ncbi:ribosomal protein S18-alanine N-acetyltransferase [Halomarina oriensis]|uniref:Ribosomal protein S18-alanine N-acetyltransferase n=1 Tax=Halomarina oriensis TaxID=671145 RepID=A0A6B0GTF7_9EURY|nr:ribosomal protein S18-alanine N-acetyltransferase [Halomarina oriensis]